MAIVMFSFGEEASQKQQKELLAKVRGWTPVASAGRIDDEAIDPAISRMCFAEVLEGADYQAVAQKLRDLPGVAHVETPPRRGLVD